MTGTDPGKRCPLVNAPCIACGYCRRPDEGQGAVKQCYLNGGVCTLCDACATIDNEVT